jgi:hypothetical protein
MEKKPKHTFNKANVSDEKLKEILKQQEQQELQFGADSLLPQRPLDKKLEIHSLSSGKLFTIKGIEDLITSAANEYFPMFPNSNPFFKTMFKLCGWNDLNPNDFVKPHIVAYYIKKYIYGRFDREVLPTLMKKDNPLVKWHIRKYKLSQFLKEEGLILMEGYIQDANRVMEVSKDWYDFELRYTSEFKLSVQLKITSSPTS